MYFKIISIVLLTTGMLQAQSLFQPGTNPYSSKLNYKIGDTVTVLVMESTTTNRETQSKYRKDGGFNVGMDMDTGTGTGTNINTGASWGNNTSGQGLLRKKDQLHSTLTVVVREVLPNGDLSVYGRNETQVDDEQLTMEISGQLSPENIETDNTVLSTRLANARIVYKTRGDRAEAGRTGWFSKIFSWIFFW